MSLYSHRRSLCLCLSLSLFVSVYTYTFIYARRRPARQGGGPLPSHPTPSPALHLPRPTLYQPRGGGGGAEGRAGGTQHPPDRHPKHPESATPICDCVRPSPKKKSNTKRYDVDTQIDSRRCENTSVSNIVDVWYLFLYLTDVKDVPLIVCLCADGRTQVYEQLPSPIFLKIVLKNNFHIFFDLIFGV